MIKIEKCEVVGWESAIRGMRNPLNSWARTDSTYEEKTVIGENDLTLMKKLRQAGTDHRKYLRMINVYADVTAPLYWWKEFDTYKVGTVANSCSTMHKIHSEELGFNSFSMEHMTDGAKSTLGGVIYQLNESRAKYHETKDKQYWWDMIQLLPTSYNQKRTILINYEVLNNMYRARKTHKLDEWQSFCSWVESLPYAKELITE